MSNATNHQDAIHLAEYLRDALAGTLPDSERPHAEQLALEVISAPPSPATMHAAPETDPTHREQARSELASRWRAADVSSVRPDWDEDRCEREFHKIADDLQSQIVIAGNEALDALLPTN